VVKAETHRESRTRGELTVRSAASSQCRLVFSGFANRLHLVFAVPQDFDSVDTHLTNRVPHSPESISSILCLSFAAGA
jgi:hypothetical protein